MKPEAVKGFIANMTNQKTGEPLSNASKQKHANNYDYFVTTHGLKWERPKYKISEIIPIIPKENNVNRIISAVGYKGHASRTFKLKSRTAEMLRIYMYKQPEEKPFPKAKNHGSNVEKIQRQISRKFERTTAKESPNEKP